MGITVNITETPDENDGKLIERIEKLEKDVEALVSALEAMLTAQIKDRAASGDLGKLEPCDCGDPNCLKQQAYEAQQAAAVEKADAATEGQYL